MVVAVIQTAVVFALFGLVAGSITPTAGWRSGLAVVIPIALFLLLSLVFESQIHSFLENDTPILGAAIVGGLIGGAVGASWRRRRSGAA